MKEVHVTQAWTPLVIVINSNPPEDPDSVR